MEKMIVLPDMKTAVATLAKYINDGTLLSHVLPIIQGIKENDEVIKDIRLRSAEYSHFENSGVESLFRQECVEDALDDFNNGNYSLSCYIFSIL